MAQVIINIENHTPECTVSDLRRKLAQVLSKLDGKQEASFTFVLTLKNYQQPALAEPSIKDPMGFGSFLRGDWYRAGHLRGDLSALNLSGVTTGRIAREENLAEPTVVFGELARPEND